MINLGLPLLLGFALFVAWRGVGMLARTGSDRSRERAARDRSETEGRITHTWVTTEEVKIHSYDSNLPTVRYRHTPHLTYVYAVGEHTYRGDRVDFAPQRTFRSGREEDTAEAERYLADYPFGADVTVYYDPDAPRQACLIPRTESDHGATRLLLGMLLLMGGVGLGALALLSAL